MKTFIYFIGTCFISTGALLGALNAKNPFPAFGIAFGLWALFFWGWNRRIKKAEEIRNRERLFEEYLRSMMRECNQK
ncbi:hypothetical protein ABIB62_004544 [Mucilaginibacter sp. UYP25]|uniref:hypothetical protein n=1 Tax=unclassified Mucilaginibacter TaxID=2617802 RepID=UPI003263A22F